MKQSLVNILKLIALSLLMSLHRSDYSFSFSNLKQDDLINGSVFLNNEGQFYFQNIYDENSVAYGKYSKSLEKFGWDFLSISSNIEPRYNATTKAYALGYLEGVLTKDRIYNHYLNMLQTNLKRVGGVMPKSMKRFFKEHHKFIKDMYNSFPSDPVLANAYSLLVQLQGMVDGYNSLQEKAKQLSLVDFHIVASTPELDDILSSDPNFRRNISAMTTDELKKYIGSRSHCSVLFKVSSDFSEIIMGHTTWTSFNSMARIFKEYRYKSGNENSLAVAFPSYPGALNSIDDFYVTDKDLIVTETTNEIFVDSLFDKIQPASLLTWERAMIANRLAVDGKSWTDIFSKFNSGTYNNQFMILDLKLIDLKSQNIKDNAFWVIEQIPGYTEAADMTQILRYGYWPSYNSAYFSTIREISGYQTQINKHPELRDHLDYSTCARANIFRRDNNNVLSVAHMKKLLRYNNYLVDKLSKNDPSLAISERKDLSDKENDCFGGMDVKIAKISELQSSKQKTLYIISGPTNDDLPTFEFSKSKCGKETSHVGLPDKYDFEWLEYSTSMFDTESTRIEADY